VGVAERLTRQSSLGDTTHKIVVGIILSTNEDGSYDVAIPDLGVTVPRLFRQAVDINRHAPGDNVAVRLHGPTVQLL